MFSASVPVCFCNISCMLSHWKLFNLFFPSLVYFRVLSIRASLITIIEDLSTLKIGNIFHQRLHHGNWHVVAMSAQCCSYFSLSHKRLFSGFPRSINLIQSRLYQVIFVCGNNIIKSALLRF